MVLNATFWCQKGGFKQSV